MMRLDKANPSAVVTAADAPAKLREKVCSVYEKESAEPENPLIQKFSSANRQLKTRLCEKAKPALPKQRIQGGPIQTFGRANAAAPKQSKCSSFPTVLGFLIYFTCLEGNCQDKFKKTVYIPWENPTLLRQNRQTNFPWEKRGKNRLTSLAGMCYNS